MLLFQPKPERLPGFEEIFFSYYPRLMQWALQLTKRDHANAEDLVHDLYIQFSRSGSRPDDVEKLDSYLFSVLRNLHYARLRRAGRIPIDDISIVDFDSFERGLASVDRRELLYVRANLKTICEYMCERKHTSRTASLLILRYFFGYHPSEIMKVVQATRGSMDRSLQIARQEARLYLERPRAIRSIAPERESTPLFTSMSDDSQTLFLDLRRAIYKSCTGACLGRPGLEQRYEIGREAGFSTAELAHLVSCERCLDDANAILGLPLLAERSPDDSLDRDNPRGPSGASGGPIEMQPQSRRSKDAGMADLRRKFDRKMREVYEHRPQSLQIAINGKPRTSQKITAEISELRLKLGHFEQPRFIEVLSEQDVRLAYLGVSDPGLHDRLEQSEQVALSDGRSLEVTLSYATDLPTVHVIYRDPIVVEDLSEAFSSEVPRTASIDFDVPKRDLGSGLAGWWSSLRSSIYEFLPDMNPTLVTALILAVSSVACFFLWLHQPPNITANALLVRAETWDSSAQTSAASGVIYQKIRIKTPHRTIERALYRDAQGVRTPRRQELQADDARLKDELSLAGVNWDAPLSATGYQDWHDHQRVRQDAISRSGSHLLKLTTTVPTGMIARASLTVRDTDFHPVARTVELRDAGTVEIAELNYDVMPWGAVNEDWFEPLAVLGGGRANRIHPAVLPHLPLLSAAEMDEAELGARLALHQLGADTSERVELTRSPATIRVTGIVATEDRKHEMEARLRQVPHVATAIYTFRDVQDKQDGTSDVTSIKLASAVERSSPLEDYLRPQGMGRDAIGELGHQFFNSSVVVNQESKAIADLLQRFTNNGLLTDKAHASLETLVEDHKARLLVALQKEESLVAQMKLATETRPGSPGVNDLRTVAERNVNLCGELISDSEEHPRTAQSIVPELAQSILRLRAVLAHMSGDLPPAHLPSSPTPAQP